ncbi:MAG: hypothetical protein HZB21_01890 [Deltaproteobacteria bacterium]|nr:hypothetical protein [Deltaproteobacteria bacterium]
MTYFLVSPVNNNPGGRKHFFWMLDNVDTWIGVARGIWRPKHEADIIKETAKAEHITRLDWTKTPFHNDSLASGWLSRDGRFYGCPQIFHDIFAAIVLGIKVGELEKTGWVRVFDSNRFVCENRLSAEQKNWLSGNGYTILDCY